MAPNDFYAGIFYTYPQDGVDAEGKPKFDLTKAVASKYLLLNGKPVEDQNPNGSNETGLYKSLRQDGTINQKSRFKNSANFLIVPANYDVSEAVHAANELKAEINSANKDFPALGRYIAYIPVMEEQFKPGGPEDIQRSKKWGVPPHEVDPAFKDAASWNFGLISKLIDVSITLSKTGAGLLNTEEYFGTLWKAISTHSKINHKLPYWKFFMDKGDLLNFDAGVNAAKALRQSALANLYPMILDFGKGQQTALAPIARRPIQKNVARDGHDGGVGEYSAKSSWGAKPDFANVLMTRLGAGAVSLMNSAAGAAFNPGSAAALLKAARRMTPRDNFLERFGKNAASATPLRARRLHDFSENVFKTMAHGTTGAAMLPRLGLGRPGVLAPQRTARVSYAPMPNKIFRGKDSSDEQRLLQSHSGLAPLQPMKLTVAAGGEVVLPRASADKNHDNKQADEYVQTRKGPYEQDLVDEQTLRQAMERVLSRQARLPPSGPTGFDPRLSPAWGALKLPG